MLLPERLAGFPLGLLARDADIPQEPVVEFQQGLSLVPTIMHPLKGWKPSKGGRHTYGRRLDELYLWWC
jgi:hypothetical protein